MKNTEKVYVVTSRAGEFKLVDKICENENEARSHCNFFNNHFDSIGTYEVKECKRDELNSVLAKIVHVTLFINDRIENSFVKATTTVCINTDNLPNNLDYLTKAHAIYPDGIEIDVHAKVPYDYDESKVKSHYENELYKVLPELYAFKIAYAFVNHKNSDQRIDEEYLDAFSEFIRKSSIFCTHDGHGNNLFI